jgi:hypothetical protein
LNTFDIFIGTWANEISVTFISCVFDVPSITRVRSVLVSMKSCVYRTQLTSLIPCRSGTPLATETQRSLFTLAWLITNRQKPVFLRIGVFTLAFVRF